MPTDGVGVQIGRKLSKTLVAFRGLGIVLFWLWKSFSNIQPVYFECCNDYIFVCADLLFPVRLLAIPNNHGDAVTTHRIDLPVNKRVVSHCPSFCFLFWRTLLFISILETLSLYFVPFSVYFGLFFYFVCLSVKWLSTFFLISVDIWSCDGIAHLRSGWAVCFSCGDGRLVTCSCPSSACAL